MRFIKTSVKTRHVRLLFIFFLILNVSHLQAKNAAIAFETEMSVEETYQKNNYTKHKPMPASDYDQEEGRSE